VWFGQDVVVVEFSFEADHNGPFAGRAATGIPVKVPGCGVYEFDPINKKITAAHIHFEFATLLKQIASHQPKVLQELLMSWFSEIQLPDNCESLQRKAAVMATSLDAACCENGWGELNLCGCFG
jgi:hypothetical protein